MKPSRWESLPGWRSTGCAHSVLRHRGFDIVHSFPLQWVNLAPWPSNGAFVSCQYRRNITYHVETHCYWWWRM